MVVAYSSSACPMCSDTGTHSALAIVCSWPSRPFKHVTASSITCAILPMLSFPLRLVLKGPKRDVGKKPTPQLSPPQGPILTTYAPYIGCLVSHQHTASCACHPMLDSVMRFCLGIHSLPNLTTRCRPGRVLRVQRNQCSNGVVEDDRCMRFRVHTFA